MKLRLACGSWVLGAVVSLGAFGADVRLRDVIYNADEVYRLPAYRGYDVDLQFEAGEQFVGLGTGDLRGLSFHAQSNHLFIKPKAADVHTDITVLTDRRVYHFDYVGISRPPDGSHADLLYALRFLYPATASRSESPGAHSVTSAVTAKVGDGLGQDGPRSGVKNADYWYCGAPELQPTAAWDDGVHTYLRFSARGEMPAMFLSDDDGSESLLNFHIENGDVVIHRVIRRLILRRGALHGCVVNRGKDVGALALQGGLSEK